MCKYAKNINSITLTKDELGDELFKTMGNLIEILVKAGYACEVYADEPGLGIYVINFDYNSDLTVNELMWVDTEKYYIGEFSKEEE